MDIPFHPSSCWEIISILLTKCYPTCLWHKRITGFKLFLVMTEKNPPILENILTPAPSVLLGQKNNWLLLAGINWSAIVKSFTRQNWCVKYQCSPKWVPREMFCFKKELLVLFLSPGQGCDSSSCEWDVICTSFAIVSHSCLVKSCQPAEHAASAALPGILGNAGYGCQLGQPLCAELKWIQNSLGAILCRHYKETQFLSKFSVRAHPTPLLCAHCNRYLP